MERIYRKWQVVVGEPKENKIADYFSEEYAVLRCKQFRNLGAKANVYEIQMNFEKNTKKIIPLLEEM